MPQISIQRFEEHHVDDAARVLTRSFLMMNKIWKHYNLSYEEIFPIMRGKLLPTLKQGWSVVLLQDGKVVGVSVSYQMLDVATSPSMPNNLQFFKKLGKVGAKLQETVDYSKLKRGDAVYGMYAVIDPDCANKGYSLKFWWQSLSIGKLCGYKYYYSRMSNQLSLKMMVKLGSQVLGQAVLEDGHIKQKFWMVRLDLTKPMPSYAMLSAMSKKPKQNAKL